MTLRFLLAIAVSLAVVLSAPFIRDLRDFIRTTFPGQFVTVVAGVVAVSIAGAIVAALARIRDRRAIRYGAIAAALVLGVAYALWNAQGLPEVDAVERFHFVEYGLITLLFYRAWRPVGDASVFVLPIFAGLIVGTAEEWLQWFIPGRVGDMRDIFLNGAAIVCGLLFSLGLDPPDRLSLRLKPGSLRRLGAAAAVTVLVFATFVHVVHLGVEVSDPEAGTFRSRYDEAALLQHSAARVAAWKANPPLQRPASRSREDQYMSEGHLHVAERNRQWGAGNIVAAWAENRILEKFYAPVLETPSYLSPVGHRWPDEQRADARQRSAATEPPAASGYQSLADVAEGRHFIRLWPKPLFWVAVWLVVAALLGGTYAKDRGHGLEGVL
jgi:VanZ like family